MRLFINALAASAGGGLTYIRNVIPHLASRPEVRLTVAASPAIQSEFCDVPNVEFVVSNTPAARRFWYEQVELPKIVRLNRTDVVLSAGNFAMKRSPAPQILLSRNSIYTSADFFRDLLARGEYRIWADTKLRGLIARKSVQWTDLTVAPSEAFASDLRRWTGSPNIVAIHHGFDSQAFASDRTPLPSHVQENLHLVEGAIKLLFVSHYNYYRNFETLFRALPLIRERLTDQDVRLLLTCKLAAGENPGAYRPQAAARLIEDLGVSEMIVELGSIPYAQLHQVYRRADIYVTPAYTETFAHPLVEAMHCGLPVIASDLPVHREICADAARYFSRFSPAEIADRVAQMVSSSQTTAACRARGHERSSEFSWATHVSKLLAHARALAERKN